MGFLDRLRATPAPKPETAPMSVSGRGHVDGFLQLEELNAALQGRDGLQVYDAMYRTDGDVRQVMNLVINPLVAGTWEVQPAGGSAATAEAIKDAELVAWALFKNMTPYLKGHLMEALPVLFRSGFAPFEKTWMRAEFEGAEVLVPRTLGLRLPRTITRWKQDDFGGLQAIEQILPVPKAQVVAGPDVAGYNQAPVGASPFPGDDPTNYSIWLPQQDLVYYRVGSEGDNWEGISMLRPAYKHWKLKDVIERLDAMAQEREALGTPICYPPLGATPDQFDAMERVLGALRSNEQGYVIMPGPKSGQGAPEGQGWLVEILGADRPSGSGRDPMPSLRYHTDKIAAAFIAEFIRLGHSLSGGARATAQVQQDPFLVSVEAISGLIEDVLNEQLVAPIIAYNRAGAKDLPRLKMSLVDATTLSQLADFVMKLTQVGAILPDQPLEDFMRERADLPPSDADAVRERGGATEDGDLRREVVMGAKNGMMGQDGETPGAPNENKPKPAGAKGSGGSGTGGKKLDAAIAAPGRWRAPHAHELHVDYDAIERHLDDAPEVMRGRGMPHVVRLAQEMADGYPERVAQDDGLEGTIEDVLGEGYAYGHQTVTSELAAQSHPGWMLDAGARDRAEGGIRERAAVASAHVLDAMHNAVAHADLNRGHSGHHRQAAAEAAGRAALRQVGFAHHPGSFAQGRHDAIELAAGDGADVRVYYSAMLDSSTCDECYDADDGVARTLDDPVRIERRPPNPACASTHSGRNQCRCFEVPEFAGD